MELTLCVVSYARMTVLLLVFWIGKLLLELRIKNAQCQHEILVFGSALQAFLY